MAVILQPVDIKYSIDLGAGFYSEVFTSGDVRAEGILTRGTRSSGAGFRRVSSGGYSSGDVRAVGILTQGTRSSGAGFRRVASGG
jgi:hypothetical protein